MSHTTTATVLKTAAVMVAGFGIVVALASVPETGGLANLLADLVFWPLDGAPRVDTPAARLLAAISGGVLVGWGVTLWLITTHVLPKDAAAAASIIRSGIIAWFVVDSLGSIAAGAPLNAVLNIGFVALFLWPLRAISKTVN